MSSDGRKARRWRRRRRKREMEGEFVTDDSPAVYWLVTLSGHPSFNQSIHQSEGLTAGQGNTCVTHQHLMTPNHLPLTLHWAQLTHNNRPWPRWKSTKGSPQLSSCPNTIDKDDLHWPWPDRSLGLDHKCMCTDGYPIPPPEEHNKFDQT